MKMIQTRTCLRFVKRSSERDYIYLFPGEGCYSYVGYQGMGEQVVSLGKGCLYLGTALHELLHAAGFHHEHTRYDRDDYLKINMENVIPEYSLQFKKRPKSSDPVDTRFDFTSVMLYGSTSFAKDKSHPTILRKNGHRIEEVYQKYSLGLYDRIRVGIFYGCKGQIRGNTK
ncbi:hypothetical protein V5799_002676 [Amblyomma americanum]|uniref:Metalloendopeptidase n=1 Tax=Amblyomma americanum TaxID=6943 RepID=A0AAQ4DB55_AMBAM